MPAVSWVEEIRVFINSRSKFGRINHFYLIEFFIVIRLTIALLFGLTLLFKSDEIPSWVKQFNRNSSNVSISVSFL